MPRSKLSRNSRRQNNYITVPNPFILGMSQEDYEVWGDYFDDFVILDLTPTIGNTPFYDAELEEWQETVPFFRDSRRERTILF